MLKLLESHPDRPLLILVDADYVLNLFTDKLNGWREPGKCKTKKGTRLKNCDLIKQIDALLHNRKDIEWDLVESHSGHLLNESADQLAGFARSQAKLGHWR